jgi:bacteriocin-like protein
MDNGKADLGKKAKPAEGSPNDIKMELSEEELSQVSGGNPNRVSASSSKLFEACATGTHIKEGKIT